MYMGVYCMLSDSSHFLNGCFKTPFSTLGYFLTNFVVSQLSLSIILLMPLYISIEIKFQLPLSVRMWSY